MLLFVNLNYSWGHIMDLNIRITGAAGQGIQTASDMLGRAVTRAGLFAYSYNDAESRIRGGLNFAHLRCSDKPAMGVSDKIDILVAFTQSALNEFGPGLAHAAVVLTSGDWAHPRRAPYQLGPLATQAGSAKAVTAVTFGAVGAMMGLERDILLKIIRETFAGDNKLIEININALNSGYDAASNRDSSARFRMPAAEKIAGRLWISGGEAVALGAVAGGVSFYAGYPMSPSTSIITSLASWSNETGVVVEQAEDEVAAINMVAGASYAGARAMTATSGGGFALMVEGLSLIGMIEVPAVIALAQRPGPATGLPTRTAQGDLNFVRHAGHGAFARIILAPRNVHDCFGLTARAFDMAEKYQVPVIIMTDQLLQDSYATVEPFTVNGFPTARHLLYGDQLNAMDKYRRYAQTESGISPMAAPGVSKQVVVVDSDEHDEDGHLIESAEIAHRMAGKRMRKAETVMRLTEAPLIEGEVLGRPLVVSWGSAYETVAEARSVLAGSGKQFAHMHFHWMWPLPRDGKIAGAMSDASSVIVVENNVGCDLESILRETAVAEVDRTINKMDGRPFTVAELVEKLGEVM